MHIKTDTQDTTKYSRACCCAGTPVHLLTAPLRGSRSVSAKVWTNTTTPPTLSHTHTHWGILLLLSPSFIFCFYFSKPQHRWNVLPLRPFSTFSEQMKQTIMTKAFYVMAFQTCGFPTPNLHCHQTWRKTGRMTMSHTTDHTNEKCVGRERLNSPGKDHDRCSYPP